MYQMTIHGESLTELRKRLHAAAEALAGNPTTAGDAAPATTRKNASSSTDAGETASPSRGPAATTAASPSDDEALDYERDVQPVVAKLGTTHGKNAVREVLKHFEDDDGNPCIKADKVLTDQWPALINKIKAAHKKLDAAKAAAEAED